MVNFIIHTINNSIRSRSKRGKKKKILTLSQTPSLITSDVSIHIVRVRQKSKQWTCLCSYSDLQSIDTHVYTEKKMVQLTEKKRINQVDLLANILCLKFLKCYNLLAFADGIEIEREQEI